MELWRVIDSLELDEEYDLESLIGERSIIKKIATFYILDALSSVPLQSEEVKLAHQHLSKTLADEILNYTIMACLGEARHAYDHSEGLSEISEESYRLVLLLLDFANARSELYRKHYRIVETLGKEKTLELCREIFWTLDWHECYGGDPWGEIADAALLYLRGKITPPVYVDTAVNLHHHNACYLDKYYNLVEECCELHGMYFVRFLVAKNDPDFLDEALNHVCVLPEYREHVMEGYKYYRLTRR